MSRKKKPAKPVKWRGQMMKLPDAINHLGKKVAERQVHLVYSIKNKQKYWCIRSSGQIGKEPPFAQTIVMRPDTLDALVKMYYQSRGTMAVEMDVRIARTVQANGRGKR